MKTAPKPRVGIFGLTSCAGDQLMILNCEDELVALAGRIELLSFGMASSASFQGKLDLAIVEGSVCTQRDLDTLLEIRSRSNALMTIGTCAVWGGIPAMRNELPLEVWQEVAYGGKPLEEVSLEKAHPISDFVPVDFVVPGYPIEKEEFPRTLVAILQRTSPERHDYSVCSECRINGNLCLVRHQGLVCCGPITAGGCKARCPSLGIPCYGCRGPVDDPHYDATAELFDEHGLSKADVINQIQRYSAPAWVNQHLRAEWTHDPERKGQQRVSDLSS